MFKGKRVLVLGLGLLGGGVATTNWLLDQGAHVTVTDLKDAEALAPSVRKVGAHIKRTARDGAQYDGYRSRLTWKLGGHDEQMVHDCDVLVVNPDVPKTSPLLALAAELGKPVLNEASIFYALWRQPVVGVTGTRGKTTTTVWCSHLLDGHARSVATGNSTVTPFLSVFTRSFRARPKVAVTELPSFLLEHFGAAPDVAVVTNLYRDHLNRYDGIEDYARTKARLFAAQSSHQHLILDVDDDWTPFFAGLGPKAKLWHVSTSPLTQGKGLYVDGSDAWFLSERGLARRVVSLRGFAEQHGRHGLRNFLGAALAAHLAGCPWKVIASRMKSLPDVPYRQEVVHQAGTLTVVNDTCATSPDGAVAALERWGGPNCILIAGGTDRDLEYSDWARAVVRYVKPENTFLLAGTATEKMRRALKRSVRGRRTFDTLDRCMGAAFARAGTYVKSVVLFSPGAKSFGPFKNEYDRGQQFNKLLKKYV